MQTGFVDEQRGYAYGQFIPFGWAGLKETKDVGSSWESAFWSRPGNPLVYKGLYPSPFRSGDVAFLDYGGWLHARTQGQWEIIELPLWYGLGVVQPLWDRGPWWVTGHVPGELRILRGSGDDWESWQEGLPVVEFLDNLPFDLQTQIWACPVTGDAFRTLPGLGLWTYRNPLASAHNLAAGGPSPRLLLHPNPSPGPVSLLLQDLPEGFYRLRILDVQGRLVRSLHDGSCTWRSDGRDRWDREVPSGIYLIQATDAAGGSHLVCKLLVLGW